MGLEMFDLTGRVAMVSGAASGMGKAMATAVAEAGADVLLVDFDQEGVEQTKRELAYLGRKTVTAVCDVSDLTAIDSLWATLDKEFGRIDFLGNVAGNGALGKPEEIEMSTVIQVIQNLVIGRFYMCQHAGKRMLKQGKGSIVNIGSLASMNALGRGHIAYSMSMGAVIQMTRELSTEWSSRGVRVNAILPGQVMNKGMEKRIAADPAIRDTWLRGLPIGRLGQPEEIKGLSVLLASDASSFITGALIPFDGGNLAKNAGGTHPGMPEN
ncbi:MAG: SDR family NAD(P)-dependent oxidoreductase [Candidatus Nanopelagicales bacterium]